MKQYRFFLEPWGWRDHHLGGRASNKHICPNCGKKTFVRYVDSETGAYLGDLVGKCDREDKCGYHYSPAMYFKDHPEAVRKDLSSPVAVKRPRLPLPATNEISTYLPRTRYPLSTGDTLRAAVFRPPISRITFLTVSVIVILKFSRSARTTSLEETVKVEQSIGRLTNRVVPAPEKLSNMTVRLDIESRIPPFRFPGCTRNS